jgi:CDGSH-type Zn-finger protein
MEHHPGKRWISWEWKEGKKFDTEEEYYLCRCGGSKEKPFCDGIRSKTKFKGKETASRLSYADQANVDGLAGGGLRVTAGPL